MFLGMCRYVFDLKQVHRLLQPLRAHPSVVDIDFSSVAGDQFLKEPGCGA